MTTSYHEDNAPWRSTLTIYDGEQRGPGGLASPTYARKPRAVLECSHDDQDDSVTIYAGGVLYADDGTPAVILGEFRRKGSLSLSLRCGLNLYRTPGHRGRARAFRVLRDAWQALDADDRAAVAAIRHSDGGATEAATSDALRAAVQLGLALAEYAGDTRGAAWFRLRLDWGAAQ